MDTEAEAEAVAEAVANKYQDAAPPRSPSPVGEGRTQGLKAEGQGEVNVVTNP